MKLVKTVLGVLLATALFTFTAGAASNAPTVLSTPNSNQSNGWTLSLGGSGAVTTQTPSTFNGGLELSLGHTDAIILPGEFGVRQGLGYSNGDLWNFSTHVYQDWTLVKFGNLEFDAGVNGGADYGTRGSIDWSVAPEAVGRLWLTKTVNAYTRVEFPFNVKTDSFRAENRLGIDVGLQVRF